jgi:uncharacterized membrane protein
MAGVGFSLRALRSDGTYTGMLRLYGAAGIISSGPWLLSILTLLFIGILGRTLVPLPAALERFQVAVTWMFAASLVWTGPIQLMFTRFAADREFLGQRDQTMPNLLGLLSLVGISSAALAAGATPLFPEQGLAFKVVACTAFATLCDVWIVVIVLTGLREHLKVFLSFALGYAITFMASLTLARFGELGLLAGFALGQAALLFCALHVLARHMPGRGPVAWGFLERRAIFLELGLIGLLYNLGVWIDKLLFWWNPFTSRGVIGPLRASELYDLPIFLGYLTIVPGMAVFLVRVETDFAECHAAFYGAVRNGASLRRIEPLRDALTDAAQRGVLDIVRVQGVTVLGCVVLGPWLLRLCGISELHLPLFYIDAVGVALQVLLLAVTSMFFYLDRRRAASVLAGLLLCSNALFTWITQRMGPAFYGYGFALAMGLTSVVGLIMLSRAFAHLVRDTFMLQPPGAS